MESAILTKDGSHLYRITDNSKLKEIARLHNLEFDSVHKYYIGDAYRDSKGDYLPTYFKDGKNRIYELKYVDGCFNPFLYVVTDAYVFCNPENGKPVHVIGKDNLHSYNYIIKKFGSLLNLYEV